MKTKGLVILCFIAMQLFSQTVTGVDTLYKTGLISKRINLVIMGDGYTTPEIPQFITAANTLFNDILSTPPYDNYKNYFNVFAIKCASPQSGISHLGNATDVPEPVIPVVSISNYFDTQFDTYGIHRLLSPVNSSAIYSVLAGYFPNYDQAIIIANSTEYGGSGGSFAIASVNSLSNEIIVHEMGHAFAGLADEYWAGNMYALEKPNMTANTNTTTLKWSQWMGTNAIGLYPHGTTPPESEWFKPHQNCKMGHINQPFCSVCQQAIIERIHSLTNPIDAYMPSNTSAISFAMLSQWFKTRLINPNPNTLKRNWKLNTTSIANNIDSVNVTMNMLLPGNNSLVFTVTDTTVLSRDLDHTSLHSYSVLWNITNSTTEVATIIPQLEYSIFPNPSSTSINIKYNLLQDSEIGISVIDTRGKKVINNTSKKSVAGQYSLEIDVSSLSEGNYFLSIKINEKTITNQIVIIN
jgi:hypothetical protein